ncbi:Regulatory protein RecX [Thiorhodovibrio winogradskyi]|uniref:Regulatory protein RecX n=1 Tax=Thiorhodovibrio winogradskyi TaxID=77007 RepID=A0ABZ0S6P5_9GAMM|nr:regulatory protein RecX [Thiorhodovibrio winogradskyi]
MSLLPSDVAPTTGEPAVELRNRALRLLGRREHSRLELERKLRGHDGPSPAIDLVLDELEQEGLLHEDRFVEAYVSERFDKGFGPLRIRSELQTRGIGEALIDRHARIDDETCFELLCRADSHWMNLNQRPCADEPEAAACRRETARRARFLESRGFPTHLIARLLRQDDAFFS